MMPGPSGDTASADTIECPRCNRLLASYATKCKYCDFRLAPPDPRYPERVADPDHPGFRINFPLLGGGIAACAIALHIFLSGHIPGTPQYDARLQEGQRAEVWQKWAAGLDAQASVEKVATPASPPLSAQDLARVCRAAIAAMNGHKPRIMKVMSNKDGVVRIRYARPSDGELWKNDCRVSGNQVEWRPVDADGPGSGESRWRSSDYGEKVTFEIKGPKVEITTHYPDSAPETEGFEL